MIRWQIPFCGVRYFENNNLGQLVLVWMLVVQGIDKTDCYWLVKDSCYELVLFCVYLFCKGRVEWDSLKNFNHVVLEPFGSDDVLYFEAGYIVSSQKQNLTQRTGHMHPLLEVEWKSASSILHICIKSVHSCSANPLTGCSTAYLLDQEMESKEKHIHHFCLKHMPYFWV